MLVSAQEVASYRLKRVPGRHHGPQQCLFTACQGRSQLRRVSRRVVQPFYSGLLVVLMQLSLGSVGMGRVVRFTRPPGEYLY
jgi:hypothetical protein